MTADRTARTVVVAGRVQGVSFRDSCRVEAESHGVAGWVRNEPDGTVRMHLEGSRDAVDAVLTWAGNGPRHARVERVEVTETEPEDHPRFEVR